MKLSEYRECYRDYSAKASELSRTLAFAGIALIWFFRLDVKPVPKVPNALLLPLCALVLALALELFQYAWASFVWWAFHRWHEYRLKDPDDDPELSHSEWLSKPIHFLFWAKVACVLFAYWHIGSFIIRAWV
jgi:hypothetical protein